MYSIIFLVSYSLSISRGEFFADFAVLGVTVPAKFYPRNIYSLKHFGSVCNSAKYLLLNAIPLGTCEKAS